MKTQDKILKDFYEFSKLHKLSGDIDPVYPVLKDVMEQDKLSLEQSIWRVLLYIAWYDLNSSEIVFEKYPDPTIIDSNMILPTGVERRGFRGNTKAFEMLNAVVTEHSNLVEWLKDILYPAPTPKVKWTKLREDFERYKYNGTWASYKWCDLCANVLDYNITAPDIGVGGSSKTASPVVGLQLISKCSWKQCAIDTGLQAHFVSLGLSHGVLYKGLEQLETCLCDFNSMYKGSYYVGHDLDLQLATFKKMDRRFQPKFFRARTRCFPPDFLGELNNWSGLRKDLKRLYADKGIVDWRTVC